MEKEKRRLWLLAAFVAFLTALMFLVVQLLPMKKGAQDGVPRGWIPNEAPRTSDGGLMCGGTDRCLFPDSGSGSSR